MTTTPVRTFDGLRATVRGSVFTPGDPGYANASTGWNLSFAHRPAVVVLAEGTPDVAAAVAHAAANGLQVAVQATGHGVGRIAEGAMLIVTSPMTGIYVDAGSATAWVGAGAKWNPVLAAAQEVGLAPLLGSSSDVGAVGYTLGGGYGWLGRKYGLSADSVEAFEVVTADGAIVRASATDHPDLFWALRGAGAGTFGVVTGMRIKLHPVTSVYAGNLFYPASMAGDVMRRWRAWIAQVPDELTSSVALMNFPPFPEVPEPLRGQSFVILRGCWSGDLDDGAALIDGWRRWADPMIDMFGPMSFADADTISADPVDPMAAQSSTDWLSGLDDDIVEALIAATYPDGGPPTLIFSEIRHVGGAVARGGDSAYGNREAELLLQMVGTTPSPEAMAAVQAHVEDLRRTIAHGTTGGAYLNLLEGDERRRRTRQGFTAAAYDRLVEIKRRYDPERRFDHGFAL